MTVETIATKLRKKREAFLQGSDRTHGEPQMERCDIKGNLHPEEQKKYPYDYCQTCSRRAKHNLAYFRNWNSTWNSKIPYRRNDHFFLFILYHSARGKYLKFGCISFQSVLKRDKEKKITTKIYLTKMCLNISVGYWDHGMPITYHCLTPIPNTLSRGRWETQASMLLVGHQGEVGSPAGISKEVNQGMASFSKGPSPGIKDNVYLSSISGGCLYVVPSG